MRRVLFVLVVVVLAGIAAGTVAVARSGGAAGKAMPSEPIGPELESLLLPLAATTKMPRARSFASSSLVWLSVRALVYAPEPIDMLTTEMLNAL